MLFRKHIVSTRTLLQLTVAMVFFVGGVGAALAANSGIAPLLTPYTVNTIAGNPDFVGTGTTPTAGYYGEGVLATPTLASNPVPNVATLDAPYDMAVDSVGNVYITDKGNNIIREVNAQTGFISTIAGVVPKGCAGANCSVRTTGCADGVPAAGAPLGPGLEGIAIDSYGNVFFDDNSQAAVAVIYRGGTQVANFITLENPAAVANSGGVVKSGYIYHVAGTLNLSTCTGTTGNIDGVMAFQSAQLKSPALLSLDSAGNIYIADTGNATVRVINTQATTQTFFQYAVKPGFIQSITNCNAALTVPCPSATTTAIANTGINGPVNAIVFNSQYKNATVDAFGNIYQLNGTGGGTGPPGIYGAFAFAGGAPITNLLTAEAPAASLLYPSPSMLPLTYGNSYDGINNPQIASSLPGVYPDVLLLGSSNLDIRPSSMRPDVFGTYWFLDTHYTELSRVDQYTSLATTIIRGGTTTNSRATVPPIAGQTNAASFSHPYYCVYGTSNIPWTQGPQTYDPWGDGCPSIVAAEGGNTASGPDALGDGLGNIYLSDTTNNLMREFPLGNAFPPTVVGTATPVTQAIQVHFNANNPPVIGASIPDGGATGNTTTAFSIAPGISDFTINTTTPEYPLGSLITSSDSAYGQTTTTANFALFAGLPTCTKLGAFPAPTAVADYDCLVYVTFNPTAPGMRQSQLVVTTANGSVYNFSLSGVGTGAQLAIDGGTATPVAATGLGSASAVAVTSAGTVYIADPANNRVVVEPAGGGTQTTVGTGLSGPMGVALDAANNVYISDTGNNRILRVDGVTGAQTVLGNTVWISGNASAQPAQYAFNHPQGLAVDLWNNVYVADTGNKVVVEIPSNIALGGAVPLLAYPGAPKFIKPVAVAVDATGNIYVADNQSAGAVILELPPGGGDLINVPGAQFPISRSSNALLVSPNGVAVDAAGDVYVSDNGTNSVVEIPFAAGPTGTPFTLNFTGLSSPAGLALDANGNLYVADSGNKQVLFDNRQTPMVNFGIVPQDQGATAPLCSVTPSSDGFNRGIDAGSLKTCVLTVTNISNVSTALTLASPITTVSGTANAAFGVTNTCGTTIAPGATCAIAPTFTPTASSAQTESLNVNGGPQKVALVANGAQPQAGIVLTSSLGLTPASGGTTTITATLTQPFIPGNTPSGTVTFTYVIDAANSNVNSCGTGGTVTAPLSGSGGTATATFNLPTLVQGVAYTVSANYNGDVVNSATQATPITVAVPGVPVTATVTSTQAQLTFTYGQPAPTIAGTLSPVPPSPITFKFTSNASATTPITRSTPTVVSYPVIVAFSGAGSCAYGFPTPLFSGGGQAFVIENPAPLTYTIPNFTAQYGAADLSYGLNGVFTGAVNGDTFSVTFTPPSSSLLNVGTYSVVPTVAGHNAGNYTINEPPSTLVITKAPTGISVSAAKTQVLNTTAGVASATFGISVSTLVSAGKGTPSGTVTVTDNFTPITSTGLGTPAAPTTATVSLVAGFGTYIPTSITPGMHQYSFSYSGDGNFQTSSLAPSATAAACTPSTPTANCLVVDNPDFTLTSLTGPVIVIPGVVPSGNGLLAAPNQSTAAPETAVLFINGILGFAGQVSLACQTQSPAYVSCFMTPPSVTVAASGTGITAATVVAIQTPTTLPLGFKFSQLRMTTSKTVLAFLPFGVLAFCVRRRRRLSKALWMLIAVSAVSAVMSGCGGNQVAFYTPIPTGPQTVTVTATYTGNSTQPAATRQFVVPINID